MKIRKTTLILAGVLLLANLASTAQTIIDVNVSNSVFTPSNISINIGDTVRWTNTGGNHNVNGTLATFPSNPESFGNSVAGAGWVYSFKFNTAGTYDYQCDVHAASGMTGQITVLNTGIDDIKRDKTISKIYPLPAQNYVEIELSGKLLALNSELSIVIYDMTGKEVIRNKNITNPITKFDTSNWPNSIYFYRLLNKSEIIETKKIVLSK